MNRVALSALISHWRQHPLQILTLFLGLALATALWSGVQAINSEARASYQQATSLLSEGALAEIRPTASSFIEQSDYVTLRRAGWNVAPVLEGQFNDIRLIGIDPLSAPAQPVAPLLSGDASFVDFITSPGLAIIHPGETSPLSAFLESSAVAPGTAIVDIGIAQELLGQSGKITRLILLPEQPQNRSNLPANLRLQAAQNTTDISRLTDSFHLNLTAFGLLSFAVGLFIVHSAIGLAFEQRRAMFRTLRALGLPLKRLVILALLELLTIAFFAGLLGIILGYLIATALLPDVAATLRGLYGAEVAGTLQFRPSWWLSGLAIALIGTLVASAAALWRLTRLPLLAPAQPRAWALASAKALRLQTLAATSLALASVALGLWGSGLVAGFGMLGAMLIAAALFLPILLHQILGVMQRQKSSALREWFWADSSQQLPGLSLALMALMLALAANIGVGTMVSSFRETFTGWLDQRLASELYVSGRDTAEAERLATFLAPRADAVLPIWNTERIFDGQTLQIYGVSDHSTYRDNWPMIAQSPNLWDGVARGDGILINEQMARRQDLWPGAPIELAGGWNTKVLGVYSDYGNTTYQVLIATEQLTTRYQPIEQLRFGVRSSNPDQLAKDIQAEFDLPGENLIHQAGLKRASLAIFERTFTVTGALNLLTFGVAGFALLTSLLTLAAMRLPQLAPVWAMGLTRQKLASLELMRALVLAALTALYALPVGLLLSWMLLSVINVSAFGWQLPMFLYPKEWALVLLLALICAALAAFWPSLRLSRMPPSDLLRVFANER